MSSASCRSTKTRIILVVSVLAPGVFARAGETTHNIDIHAKKQQTNGHDPSAARAKATADQSSSPGPAEIELTCVDPQATGYATFQSHNQKVVANARGYFMTHIRTRNEAYTAQQWRLSWSQDHGKSFHTLYEATHATNPPLLETDAENNIYLIRADFEDGHAYLYRFLSKRNYREPLVTRISGGAAGKYSMAIDEKRAQLYYFAHNNTFHRVALDGQVLSSVDLLEHGENAVLQYPLLQLDDKGTLHAAWTTQKHGVYLYWDIHYLRSEDGGDTWQTMDGSDVQLPVIADETGPADRISLDDEFEGHTWLSSFFVRAGKAHFFYLAQTQPPRQHYMRFNTSSGQRELDVAPDLQGQTIALRSLDGFFAIDRNDEGGPIFIVSRERDANRLACLASYDDGKTWQDHAVSIPVTNTYSIGGARNITEDGWIIGSFTEQISGSTLDDTGSAKVYFFRCQGTR